MGRTTTVTIALHKTNMGICLGFAPGYSLSVLEPVKLSRGCYRSVGPHIASPPQLMLLSAAYGDWSSS